MNIETKKRVDAFKAEADVRIGSSDFPRRDYKKALKVWAGIMSKISREWNAFFPASHDLIQNPAERKTVELFWNGLRQADSALSNLARRFS